jgi:ELWxxDGT repeat protein
MVVQRLDFSLAAALALLSMAFPAALPAAPYLVKDLNTSLSFNPGQVELAGRGVGPGVSYFSAADPAHGIELWRSDGTPGGTERLTDICAGRCDSLPAVISVQAGRVFFKANDGFSGDELWVSDGTPGSERRVRDLCPGLCSAYPYHVEEVGDRLLFFSYFQDSDRTELWQTDGTREGTVLVKVLCTGNCYVWEDLISIGERALFIVNGLDVWATDGTAAGTLFLRRFAIESTHLAFFPSLFPGDGFAWVWDADGLWRTDGTAAGTFLLERMDEITTDPDFSHDFDLETVWHGQLFGVLGSGEVIRSDGTPEGTYRIASFSGHAVAGLAPLEDEILFQVNDASGPSVLWSTRGTAETTGPKLSLEAAEEPTSLTSLGGRAVFLAGHAEFIDKNQLWVTDGTTAGTRQLALPPGFVYRGAFFPNGDGRALFFREFPKGSLWVTDGTEAGTHEVRSFWNVPGSSGPREQAALGGKLVFSAMVSDARAPLFVSDGTAAGTALLSEKADHAFSFFQLGERLVFSASRIGGYPPGTWVTDGTPDGTARVSHSGFSRPARFGGQLLFRGTSGYGSELMKADRLLRTVEIVKDIDPFVLEIIHHQCVPESSDPLFGGAVGGRMLFAADDGRSGRELWASDGTAAGTVLVRDIHPGRSSEAPMLCQDQQLGPHRHDIGLSSDPRDFVILGSVALFTADDGVRGRELWITNGTLPGTHRVADLVRGPRGSAPHDLVRFQNRVYFLAGNPGLGESLWRTDGTARGTTRVLDLTLDGLPSWGRSLTVAAGGLFFTVFNETTGAELWASTGDAGGTGLVTDLNPGPGSSSVQFVTAVGETLLFAADDGLTGLEPWRTDGTAAGTVRLGDIAPGRDASSPGPFTAIKDVVMTGADDGIHGREPWAIPRAEIRTLEKR